MEHARYRARRHSREKAQKDRRQGRYAQLEHQYRAEYAAERECAIDRQIRKVEDRIGYVHAQRQHRKAQAHLQAVNSCGEK